MQVFRRRRPTRSDTSTKTRSKPEQQHAHCTVGRTACIHTLRRCWALTVSATRRGSLDPALLLSFSPLPASCDAASTLARATVQHSSSQSLLSAVSSTTCSTEHFGSNASPATCASCLPGLHTCKRPQTLAPTHTRTTTPTYRYAAQTGCVVAAAATPLWRTTLPQHAHTPSGECRLHSHKHALAQPNASV